jgi:anti-sigma-K factor RskA
MDSPGNGEVAGMPRLDRYQDPKLIERLAGDYVLGTMGGRARRRFRQLMAERGYIEQAVSEWERRLNPLGNAVAPVAPHPRVWRHIRREIAADRRRRKSFWSSLTPWQTTMLFAVVILGGLLTYQILAPVAVRTVVTPAVAPVPSYVSVLVNKKHIPMIVATATKRPQRLIVFMMQKPRVPADKDLELWAIPQKGGAPISMGLLSKGQKTLVRLNKRDTRVIPKTSALAISREPKGGSPTGSPTGPVLYQGPLKTL